MRKRITSITIIAISVLLVGLYTVASTYSVIINVVEKDGVAEIVNEINIKELNCNRIIWFNDKVSCKLISHYFA